MEFYAIRHKPTGNFLPYLGRQRGHTYTEPKPMTEAPPRLHRTLKQAKLALGCWLKGVWKQEYGADEYSGVSEYEGNLVVSKPDRRAEDMEIVLVRLVPLRF